MVARPHLRVVPHAAEQIVGDARRPARTGRDLQRPVGIDADVQLCRRARHDGRKLRRLVVAEAVDETEAGAERRGDEADARCRAHEGEARQFQTHAAGVRPLVDEDVDREVLHRGVEIFLHRLRHAVDLVDEDDVARLQGGQESGEVRRLREDGPARRLHVDAHRVAEDVRERCLAETGRTREQHVVQRLPPVLRGLDRKLQPVADFPLADEIGELLRTQLVVESRVPPVQFLARAFVLHPKQREGASRGPVPSLPERMVRFLTWPAPNRRRRNPCS